MSTLSLKVDSRAHNSAGGQETDQAHPEVAVDAAGEVGALLEVDMMIGAGVIGKMNTTVVIIDARRHLVPTRSVGEVRCNSTTPIPLLIPFRAITSPTW